MTGRKLWVVAQVLGTAIVAAFASACGRVEGGGSWHTALHEQHGEIAKSSPEQVFPVPKPEFTEPDIFPCSRCHEGGQAVKDERPAMPHAAHAAKGLECTDCHAPEDPEAAPKIPSREVCDTCHGDPTQLSAGAQAYFTAVTNAEGKTVFPRRWATRDVSPEHERHAKADVTCEACHGAPPNGAFEKPKPVTLMERCIACHTRREVGGAGFAASDAACAKCHTATTARRHANVVLDHAEEQRGCLDCHDEHDRDHLRLANGTKLAFEESFKLCGQCHGTQFRDWKVGLHGKRTGSWSGRREYRLCVHCHWPHAPKFAPMTPSPPPMRPEEIR